MNDKLKFDICVVGGCSMDMMYYENEHHKFPKKPNVIIPGGKGSNQAVAAARAGANVSIITRLGNDAIGKKILNNLTFNNISTNNVELVKEIQNDYSHILISNSDKDNNIIRFSGAIESFDEDLIERHKNTLLNSKMVVAQFKMPKTASVKLIDFCYDNNIPIMVTPCRPKRLIMSEDNNRELIEKITYITCNEEECKTVFDLYSSPEEACKAYPNKLIVTLGWRGLVYHDGVKIVYLPAITLDKIEDTTGAGDTFAGNLAYHLTNGYTLYDAIERSQYASAMKIMTKTAQAGMPYKDELDKFIRNTQTINFPYIEEFELAYRAIKESYELIKNKKLIVPVEKADKSFVTASDILVEKRILELIKVKFPIDTFVTEETNSGNTIKGRTWILDPIDGTLDYLKGGTSWSIQLAFVDKDKVQFSIIYMPLKNKLIYAVKNKGVFINNRKVSLNDKNELNATVIEMCGSLNKFYEEKRDILDFLMKDKKIADIKYNNICSEGFANIVCGNTDALIVSTKKLWDVTPGIFMLEQLGINEIKMSENLSLYTNNKNIVDYLNIK